MEVRPSYYGWFLPILFEDVSSSSVRAISTAAAIDRSSVEQGRTWSRSTIVVELLHSCLIIMYFGTWTCWLDMLVSNMRNVILGLTSIIRFAGKRCCWTRAILGSNGTRPLVGGTTITVVPIIGFIRAFWWLWHRRHVVLPEWWWGYPYLLYYQTSSNLR